MSRSLPIDGDTDVVRRLTTTGQVESGCLVRTQLQPEGPGGADRTQHQVPKTLSPEVPCERDGDIGDDLFQSISQRLIILFN